ncbi:MAG: deoxyguanosinetriphosphate triphosphohydrolase [Acidobacteriia bacterium]|nr:deoxyguanosinetriphosphate triphosphohydrolase [Terriglobia bacterium]
MAPATYAMDVANSRGRRFPEPSHPYRNAYARDRDRVIHSRAFRRLEAKTQVFTTRYSDHFRNRLTHTLEVAQIARTAAGALELNTDLAEALSLAHDIGHPPFGHAGERKLDELLRPYGERFNHNLQALRIVEEFEQRYLDFPGLNLTFEVREGIVKHSRDYDTAQFPELAEYLLDERPPLESQLIDFVDEIAYNSADLDDGFESKLLDIEMICASVPLFAEFYEDVERTHLGARDKLKFNETVKRMLDRVATDLIENTRAQVAAAGAHTLEDIRRAPRRLAGFSPKVAAENAALKRFLHTRLYNHPSIVIDRERSVDALTQLFAYYLDHPEAMPKSYTEFAQRNPPYRIVCDYIAGMTDHFLLRQHAELLGAGSARSAD